MVGEIGGGASYFFAFGKHVPECFTKTDDVLFHKSKIRLVVISFW